MPQQHYSPQQISTHLVFILCDARNLTNVRDTAFQHWYHDFSTRWHPTTFPHRGLWL